jgi:hypothetical protein
MQYRHSCPRDPLEILSIKKLPNIVWEFFTNSKLLFLKFSQRDAFGIILNFYEHVLYVHDDAFDPVYGFHCH